MPSYITAKAFGAFIVMFAWERMPPPRSRFRCIKIPYLLLGCVKEKLGHE